ncbi:MAG: NAD(P)-dependent oxidoreductase [Spirulina sp. SIO3F2]|nr:NAD(P)-dependent oxidoreductase [Spirulina sp. SIO3F2]
MKIIITGGAGFIGAQLAEQLSTQGHDVITWDLRPHPSEQIKSEIVDVLDIQRVMQGLQGIDVVYHLAGPLVGFCRKHPNLATQLQIQGTTNMLEAAKENKIQKFLLASSFYVYDGIDADENVDEDRELCISKMGLFGAIKVMSERLLQIYAQKYNFEYSILRFGSTYGYGNSSNAVKDFLEMGFQKKEIAIWGKGYRRNQYTFINDVVEGCMMALEQSSSDIYNLVSPEQTSTADLAEMLRHKYGFNISFMEDKKEGPSMAYISANHAQMQLGWKTIPLIDGLNQIVSQMEAVYR